MSAPSRGASRPPRKLAAAETALRAHALAKPLATEHFPWGERAIKVKGKVFLFMYADATKLSLSTKLPASNGVALMLPFANPTGYGLGKAGWVSASFGPTDEPPVEMLRAWVDESYQAVAPAKLAATARGGGAPAKPAPRRAAKPAAKSAKSPKARPASAKAERAATSAKAKPAATSAKTKSAAPSAKAKPAATSAKAKRGASAKPTRRAQRRS